MNRAPKLLAVAALAVAWVVTLTLAPWSDESVGDLDTRSSFAALLLDGELPYRDFFFEYPPLAAPVIALSGLAGTNDAAYRLGIAGATLVAALALLLLARSLARRTGGSETRAMLAVAAAPLLLGAVVRLHFDLVAVALAVAGIVAVLKRRPAAGLTLVGLGAMTKGFPLAIAPVALAWLWAGGDRRGALRGAAALAATVAALAAASVAISPQGAFDALAYQLDRPVQVESAPASVLWGLDALGAERPLTRDSHGSVALEHPLAGAVGLAFAAALAFTVVALTTLAARSARPSDGRPSRGDPRSARSLVLAALASLAACAALGPVLSPQFLTWTVPLLALALAWRMHALAAMTATACLLTLAEFPARYFDLVAGEPTAVAITAARNAALVAALVIALRSVRDLSLPRLPARRAGFSSAARAPARSIAPVRPARPR